MVHSGAEYKLENTLIERLNLAIDIMAFIYIKCHILYLTKLNIKNSGYDNGSHWTSKHMWASNWTLKNMHLGQVLICLETPVGASERPSGKERWTGETTCGNDSATDSKAG